MVIFNANNIPVAQNVLASSIETSNKRQLVDVKIALDPNNGIYTNVCFEPINIYDANYENTQTHSPVYMNLIHSQVQYIAERCEGPFLEIGCGNGEFLKLLQVRTLSQIQGFDPALTVKSDEQFIKGNLSIEKLKITPKTIILRHVLEHIDDAPNFLGYLQSHFPTCKIYIETPNLNWKISNNSFLDFYNEHKYYFTADNLAQLFANKGSVFSIFGGQYLSGLFNLNEYTPIIEKPMPCSKRIRVDLTPLKATSHAKIIWGASSRGVMLATYCKQNDIPIAGIVDTNPKRVGLYVPGTSLQVVDAKDILQMTSNIEIIILNKNYVKEVKDITDNKYQYKEFPNV